MPPRILPQSDRRNFIKTTSLATALGAMALPCVHAQEGDGNTIQLAVIGCVVVQHSASA